VSWQDKNDLYYLAQYKLKRHFQSVLALCFTQSDERFHYWRVFGDGSSGVCIQFHRDELLNVIRRQDGIRARQVKYRQLARSLTIPPRIDDLPFVKRVGFADEYESRLVYGSLGATFDKLDIDIPLSCIHKVTLSPLMHPDLFDSVREVLVSIDGCENLDVSRSTLISNEQWQRLAEKAQ
jgi:hypothetical protein